MVPRLRIPCSKRCSEITVALRAPWKKAKITKWREHFDLARACRNRTYQPPYDGLSDFEDRANHQIRTLPCAKKSLRLGLPSSRGGNP